MNGYTETSLFERDAQKFNEQTGLSAGTTPDSQEDIPVKRFNALMHELEWRRRFSALQEEVGEVEDAVNDADYTQAKRELADVAVTLFSMADALNVDIRQQYNLVMAENMRKSETMTRTGKVTDDS